MAAIHHCQPCVNCLLLHHSPFIALLSSSTSTNMPACPSLSPSSPSVYASIVIDFSPYLPIFTYLCLHHTTHHGCPPSSTTQLTCQRLLVCRHHHLRASRGSHISLYLPTFTYPRRCLSTATRHHQLLNRRAPSSSAAIIVFAPTVTDLSSFFR